jgi:gamma-glutamylcyclotransferase (GGCT)/AIG2-like uncharacterized protein YtfP
MSLPVLATYGTLMRAGGSQASLGVESDLTYVADCQWAGVLYDLGAVPGAVPGECMVHGELFRLSSPRVWTVLDAYEGYDPDREAASLYVRRRVSLAVPRETTAWVYWYNGPVEDAPRVTSGDWAAYRADGAS